MPRYFFNVKDGRHLLDQEGTVLASPEAARLTAVATSGAMIRDHSRKFWKDAGWQMHVTDEHGATVCDLHLTGTVGAQ